MYWGDEEDDYTPSSWFGSQPEREVYDELSDEDFMEDDDFFWDGDLDTDWSDW